jgi:phenylacetic acid degradation operon negative regulatory protein
MRVRGPGYRAGVTAVTEPTNLHGQVTALGTPRAYIVSLYGAYVRRLGGWLSVAALVNLMAELEVDEPAVRSAISRLKRRGLLVAERRGQTAGYSLSGGAEQVLRAGDKRIFSRPTARLEDGWVLAVFSVPESERAKRHTLRSRLGWLGFGTAAPGVWIAPAYVADEAREAIDRLGLAGYVDLFTGRYLAFADLARAAGLWWDLRGLADRYEQFIGEVRPMRAGWDAAPESAVDDLVAFADHVRTLTGWRRIRYLDPGLPSELLPEDWPGTRASELFFGLHDLLSGPALRHVRTTEAHPIP